MFNTIVSSFEITILCLFNKNQKYYKIYMKKSSLPDEKDFGWVALPVLQVIKAQGCL